MIYRSWYPEVAAAHVDALYNGGEFVSSRVATQIIGRGKTVAAEFMVWFREHWVDFFNPSTGRLSNFGEEKAHDTSVSDQDKTWTDERSGTVFTDLGEYGIISFTQGEFRSIKRDYSKHYGGKSLSKSEITIRYNFPTPHAFDLFRRIHFLYQNGIPYTDREIEEEGIEALVEKSIESKRQKFMLDLSAREHEQMKRDAEKWRAFEVNAELIVSRLTPSTAAPAPLRVDDPAEPYALVISLTDLHLGMLAHDLNGKVIWNQALAAKTALASLRDLMSEALMRGRPDEIQLLICSDGIHVDSGKLQTTAGTPQGEQSDGTYREMVENYIDMVQEAVSLCARIAPVRLLAVEGNHDRETSTLIGLMLARLYKGHERVTVETQRAQGGIMVNYGDTTLFYTHGDTLPRGKALSERLWPALRAIARRTGLPLMGNILSFGGHLHHEDLPTSPISPI